MSGQDQCMKCLGLSRDQIVYNYIGTEDWKDEMRELWSQFWPNKET